MMQNTRLPERLKEMRKAKGLTQRDMARYFRITDVGYGGWERGETEPSVTNIIRLCEFFGCTSDSLIGIASPPTLPPSVKRMEELKNRLSALSVEVAKASKAIDDFTEKKMVR